MDKLLPLAFVFMLATPLANAVESLGYEVQAVHDDIEIRDYPPHVLATVREDGMQARGESWPEADKSEFMQGIRDTYDHEGHPFFASARLWDDGVIDPKDTRKVLALAMSFATKTPQQPQSEFGIFRM